MIAQHNHQIDVKSEQRRNAEKAKKSGYILTAPKSQLVSCIAVKCSECKKRIPTGEPMVVERSGEKRCIQCDKLKKHCAICSAPFYSRVNNKKTCSLPSDCSRQYELKRARERYQELSARANASY